MFEKNRAYTFETVLLCNNPLCHESIHERTHTTIKNRSIHTMKGCSTPDAIRVCSSKVICQHLQFFINLESR